jgi:hypothetical protein
MSDTTPDLRWFAIFADQPQATVEVDEPGDILGRFDMAGQFGHIATRRLKAMWIIRREDESDDVLRVHGSVPAEISARFYADLRHKGR